MFRDGPERLLVFRLGGERFAVRLGDVHEVIDAPPIRAIPDAGAGVRGLATIRGELVRIHDLAPMLNVGGATHATLLLFVRAGRRIGIAVDDVQDAIVVEEADVRPAPGTEARDGILVGVLRRADGLVAVLRVDALIDATLGVAEGEKA